MMQLKPSFLPSISPSPTRVILVRHGRSTFNEQGRYQGSSNASVLTSKGWQAARQTGNALQNLKFDAIYTSPLQRVQETVAAMQQAMQSSSSCGAIAPLNPPIYPDLDLREIDIPAWEGLPFSQVRTQFARDYWYWKHRPHEFRMQRSGSNVDFSPVLDLYQRAEQFWKRILPRHLGRNLLVVAHGGTNHALLSTAIGLAPQHHHILQQSNCGISIVDFFATQPPQLRSLNSTYHLHETLPKLKEGKQGLRLLLLPIHADGDYPTALVQQLADQLQSTAIDLSVSAKFPQAERAIDQILCHHPTTLQFQTSKVNFLQDWQQTIAQRNADSDRLMTALVVTDIEQIQHLIADAMGLSSDRIHTIHLEPANLNILHYPAIHHSPILQSLNFNPLSVVSSLQRVCP